MLCLRQNSGDVKRNGERLGFDERLKWLHRVYKFYYVITGRSINQSSKKYFWTENKKTMILRNIIWIHSLTWTGMIKGCCSIHAIRNSFILLLAKQIWKNQNYSRHSKECFLNKNWIKLFGEVLNLVIKNNSYWIKISCLFICFFKYSLKSSIPQHIKGLVGTNWPLN